MKTEVLQIRWHYDANDDHTPIYSVDFQKNGNNRFATCGGDSKIRIWKYTCDYESMNPKIEFLSTLSRHAQAVNVARFSPQGDILATAGDEGTIFLWVPSSTPAATLADDAEELALAKEFWKVKTVCRSMGAEVYDICWSPDGNYLIAGAMDNSTRIYNTQTGQLLFQNFDHLHYVQGVAWDPLKEYVVTQSSDRSICVYKFEKQIRDSSLPQLNFKSRIHRIEYLNTHNSKSSSITTQQTSDIEVDNVQDNNSKDEAYSLDPDPQTNANLDAVSESGTENASKITYSLYCNETLVSFFRRPTFSPDGFLLITPAGKLRLHGQPNTESIHTVYIYTRSSILRQPVASLTGFPKPAIAVRFSPKIYELRQVSKHSPPSSCIELPYRMIFAIACQDAVYIYDTQSCKPFYRAANLHYSTLTDLAWSDDGTVLLMTSIDGFCSSIKFTHEELGNLYEQQLAVPAKETTPAVTVSIPAKPEKESKSSKESKVKENDPSQPQKKRIAPTPLYPQN
ncbi:histone H3-H4 chaperone, CAF assembly factor (CAF-1) complex subunit B, Pcf2 [Schizosaccharomyces osmophilus]|uniref:Histone H3-H4 chaperone, CAF assembly factor (CAF-1) complex subunit B, Pcf2 n=1 Tax=Schizosaccharomyces osmophilus TaxID=2545709 RepID=A0AAF0AWV5_9SCHI|nr:histone H3-H4 chaperone, CAF assembly factor (CAF-1) complex subunit B, Pcf2 [Schizosaccharomyces osmophilus]WBW75151.1 histone H3-H4 chaperone, CAF assembly factor (CAF-1) complex subunit B, Pcf2 [Schizosaccharomyces osmophilus]